MAELWQSLGGQEIKKKHTGSLAGLLQPCKRFPKGSPPSLAIRLDLERSKDGGHSCLYPPVPPSRGRTASPPSDWEPGWAEPGVVVVVVEGSVLQNSNPLEFPGAPRPGSICWKKNVPWNCWAK